MRSLTIAVLLLALCLPCFAQGHFHFSGPMSQFMPEGATPGVVTSGLPFAVVLTDKGATIAPTHFELKGTSWAGAAVLTLDNAKYADGHLTATIKLQNDAGGALEGLRLDVTGATEEYKAKDDQGKDILKTRAQAVSIASPLLLGDVPKGEAADSLPLDAGTITFQPETTQITVTGTLSGLYYTGSFTTEADNCSPATVDFDAQGRLYFGDAGHTELYRSDADGNHLQTVAKLPTSAQHLAVDPKTGDILAVGMNQHVALRFTAGGDDKGQLPADGDFSSWPGALRFDHAGHVYIAVGNSLTYYEGDQRLWELDAIGAYDFGGDFAFDVDGQGNVWLAGPSCDTLFRFGAKGANGKRIAIGPDWHLGRVSLPQGVRVDAQGNVYIIEGKKDDEFQRVSVLDRNGKFVRVFGRAAKAPKEDGWWDGQISPDAKDLAFGPDGRVYVANGSTPASIMIFRPF